MHVTTLNAILYITYDGLLDPLGASQILPYIKGIAKHPRKVIVLSFEKRDRFNVGYDALNIELKCLDITWVPLAFSEHFGALGKVYDFIRMHYHAIRLAVSGKVKIIHARGHLAAQAGLLVKRITNARLLFDFRGFWVDERVDKGGWDLSKPFDIAFFKLFKYIERHLLKRSDWIVCLSHAAIPELLKLSPSLAGKISVVPCSADFEHFQIARIKDKLDARLEVGISQDALVIGYLGSIGKMYLFDRYIELVIKARSLHARCIGFILTNNLNEATRYIDEMVEEPHKQQFIVRQATRIDIPRLIACFDMMVSFIRPTFSKIAASPTKMAECLAMGVPVVSNSGIGDVDIITERHDAGYIISSFEQGWHVNFVQNIDRILSCSGERLRRSAHSELSLQTANESYAKVYRMFDSAVSEMEANNA